MFEKCPLPFPVLSLGHGCPTFWLPWAALSEEELSWAAYTYVTPKEMPLIYFHVNYIKHKEHCNTV